MSDTDARIDRASDDGGHSVALHLDYDSPLAGILADLWMQIIEDTDAVLEASVYEDRRDGGDEIPVLLVRAEEHLGALSDYLQKLVLWESEAAIALHPDRVAMNAVESSNVDTIGWDGHLGVIYVTFQGSDGTYLYLEADAEDWSAFNNADSYGRHLNAEIKGAHPCILVE